MAKRSIAEYDLFVDESGDFKETSRIGQERRESNTGHRHQAHSQFAGLLAPRGEVNTRSAWRLLERLEKRVGQPVVHGTKIKDRATFNRLITELISQLNRRGWQVVRLVNTEAVMFGDRATTHINLASEMVVRVFQLLQQRHKSDISIRFVPAAIYLGEDQDGGADIIDHSEYEIRLYESIGYINVRRGLAYEARRWHLEEVDIGSAKKRPELILCDLLSNASYSEYRRLDRPARNDFIDSAGEFNFTLLLRDLLARVRLLIDEGSIGMAVIALGEHLVRESRQSDIKSRANELLESALAKLQAMPDRLRNPQLLHIANWLEQVIEGQRSLRLGEALATWMENHVLQPLQQAEDDSAGMDWFAYNLAFLRLTACNHTGLLRLGARHAASIQGLAEKLARKVEHAHLLARGLIAVAVHKTDCMEFDEASSLMKTVVQSESAIAEYVAYFADELGSTDDPIRSDIRAQALGTWLQSEMLAGRIDRDRLALARELNDQAIAEFTDPADVARQHQYRCQLETAAGNYDEAIEHLVISLSLESDAHDDIGRHIMALGNESAIAQGFAFLHWIRIGACLIARKEANGQQFDRALQQSGLLTSAWASGDMPFYPIHGIVRRIAKIHAIHGNRQAALSALDVIADRLNPATHDELTLQLIQIAATVEVADALWDENPAETRKTVLNERRRGLPKLLLRARKNCGEALPRIESFLKELDTATNEWMKPDSGQAIEPRRSMMALIDGLDY